MSPTWFKLLCCVCCVLLVSCSRQGDFADVLPPLPNTQDIPYSWDHALRTTLGQFHKNGGYSTGVKAFSALTQKACQWDSRTNKPVFSPVKATPSFCSSACYLLLLTTLQHWDCAQNTPQISSEAWRALMPIATQRDGEGPWGYANANGPGLAVLIHQLGAGVNFTDWSKARPGDFMKIFWTDAIGRYEHGHLTVLVHDYGESVAFWSSNMTKGYGVKIVPKSDIKRVIFSRITKPQNFNHAPSIGYNSWLNSLLRRSVTMRAVRQQCGM